MYKGILNSTARTIMITGPRRTWNSFDIQIISVMQISVSRSNFPMPSKKGGQIEEPNNSGREVYFFRASL